MKQAKNSMLIASVIYLILGLVLLFFPRLTPRRAAAAASPLWQS